MTPQDLAARLAAVRIPESFARFDLRDALAACALGLICGLAVAALLRRVTVRKAGPVERARAGIAALAGRDRQTRIAGLAALLRDHGGPAPEGLDAALYDPRAPLDPGALEAAVLSAAGRRPRR